MNGQSGKAGRPEKEPIKEVRILLILPAYNEEKSILSAVGQIRRAAFPDGLQVDYLVIDDGSTDRTAGLCRKHGIPCLSLIQNLGIGGAVQTGYLYAERENYDIAVQFDGDGQHDIGSLEALIAPVAAGECDFTVGSRFTGNISDRGAKGAPQSGGFQSTFLRRLGIRYLSTLIRLATGRRIRDVTSGYRAANREVIRFFVRNYPADYPEPESLVRLFRNGFRVREVPANMFPRKEGKSSISALRSVYYMLKVTLSILYAATQKEGKLS